MMKRLFAVIVLLLLIFVPTAEAGFNANRVSNPLMLYDFANNAIEIPSITSLTRYIKLSTYKDTDASGTSALIRLYAMDQDAKPMLAFYDENAVQEAWVGLHHYLHYYLPLTFATTDVDTVNDWITIASSGWATGWKMALTTTGTLPAGLSATQYVCISGSHIKFYDTSAHATTCSATGLVDITTTGSGTGTVTPDNTYNNNEHKHFMVEVADSTGAKQSRLSIPYGYDTTEMGVFSSNFNVNGGKLRVVGASSGNRDIVLGNTLSDNLVPDGSEPRWAVRADALAESGANAGSDLQVVRYSDAGAAIDSPFYIKRSTGFAGFGGFGTTVAPQYSVSLARGGARTIGINDDASGAGSALTIQGGNALTSASDVAGGNLVLNSGTAQGTGTSEIQFATPASGGGTGSTTRTLTTRAKVQGLGLVVQAGSSGVYGRVGGNLNVNTSSVANGTTVETDLITYSVTGSTLLTSKDYLETVAWGTFAANGNNKTVRAYFGATKIFDSGTLTTNSGSWKVTCDIVRTGTTTQVSVCEYAATNGTTSITNTASPGETLSGASTFKMTGQSGTASSDITELGHIVRFWPGS